MNGHRFTSRYVIWEVTLILAALVGCAAMAAPAHRTKHSRSISSAKQEYEGMALTVRTFFAPLPKRMPGSENDTPQMVALGRKLYFEPGISLNKSQSCSDCHQLNQRLSGTDGKPTSKGAKGSMGKRNAPTVLNAGFEIAQFWDGRAPDLAEQAKGPVLNPIEMGMRTREDVENRLRSQERYRRSFKTAFPNQAEPVTFNNMASAIAAFERTLVTPARFDRYLKGDTSAITSAEKRGLYRFVNTGCIECHNSHSVGGRSLQKLGVYHPYSNRRDLGRYEVTHRQQDKYVFKVPMLRNVTRTQPYFMDGQVAELPEAVRLMAWMQLGKKLSPSEINEIIRFLHTLEAERPLTITGA